MSSLQRPTKEPPKPEAPMEVKFKYVEQYNQLPKVISALSFPSTPHVLLDCEGQEIGSVDGVLSLISVGTAQSKEIFVVDVVRLHDHTNPFMHRFLQILSDPTVTKVIWDGRMDYTEIFATFGVRLEGVLDLQIAEVMGRETVNGERDFQRRGRLKRLFDKDSEILKDTKLRPLLKDFHAIQGLQGAIRENKIVENLAKDDEVVAMHKDGNSSFWLTRPLPPNFLMYAATDIKMVGLVYDHFVQTRYITANNYMGLIQQTGRYISYYDSRGKKQQAADLGVMLRLLPLDVVYEPEAAQYPCHLCQRMLNLRAFETLVTSSQAVQVVSNKNKSKGSGGAQKAGRPSHRRPCCRMCAICTKANDVAIPVDWVVI